MCLCHLYANSFVMIRWEHVQQMINSETDLEEISSFFNEKFKSIKFTSFFEIHVIHINHLNKLQKSILKILQICDLTYCSSWIYSNYNYHLFCMCSLKPVA